MLNALEIIEFNDKILVLFIDFIIIVRNSIQSMVNKFREKKHNIIGIEKNLREKD